MRKKNLKNGKGCDKWKRKCRNWRSYVSFTPFLPVMLQSDATLLSRLFFCYFFTIFLYLVPRDIRWESISHLSNIWANFHHLKASNNGYTLFFLRVVPIFFTYYSIWKYRHISVVPASQKIRIVKKLTVNNFRGKLLLSNLTWVFSHTSCGAISKLKTWKFYN